MLRNTRGRRGGVGGSSLYKIQHIHSTIMKPGTVIRYIKKIIEAPTSPFSLEISNFCYIGK